MLNDLQRETLTLPPSPLQEIFDERVTEAGLRLLVKRDDLLAPAPGDPWCGNKWRKLKYNLLHAQEQGFDTLISFGGAHSNHLAALAGAGRWLGFRTVGIVRGEPIASPTLERAEADGMELHFVSRREFSRLLSEELPRAWEVKYPRHYLLPMGGSNSLALSGCAELAGEIINQLGDAPTTVAVSCGTGGTLAGLVLGLRGRSRVLGVAALKGDFLDREVQHLLQAAEAEEHEGWEIINDYHFGGFAKYSPELLDFIRWFQDRHAIQLEPLYTGKLFFGLYDLMAKGYFAPGHTVVAVHTGGLQGLAGFETRFQVKV